MLDITITDDDLGKAVEVLNNSDTSIFQPAFKEAGDKIVIGVVKDLKGGVAHLTGGLQGAITGNLIGVQGAQVDFNLTGSIKSGYDYAGRLDKDGGMTWRRGKYAGRKTFGWFTYQTRKRGGSVYKISRRELRTAVQQIINSFVRKLKAGGGS